MRILTTCLFATVSLAFSAPAFAISNGELAKKCLVVGKKKVAAQAAAYGCDIDSNRVQVYGIDNRLYNPSKYIWYRAAEKCEGAEKIVQLVQYYGGRCF